MRFASIGVIILFSVCTSLQAQPHSFPMNNDLERLILQHAADSQYNFHASIKAFQEDRILNLDTSYKSFSKEKGLFSKGVMNNALISGGENFKYEMSPIIYSIYSVGKSVHAPQIGYLRYQPDIDPYIESPDAVSESNYWLGAGLQFRSSFKDKVAFGVNYTYSRFGFPEYLDSNLPPGFGELEPTTDGGTNYINHFYTGYLAYAPSKVFSFEIGRGKHFYGNGYRSLLLSDFTDAYPYGKIVVDIWKIKYQVLYSQYKSREYNSFDEFNSKRKNKYSTSNYLSMNIGKHANVSLFQSVIWQAEDSLHDRGFDVNYLNPFIFMRPVEFSIGSPDNMLLGLDFSYTIFKRHQFYAQFILDEFILDELKAGNGWWGNKYGFQLGLKFHDFFKIKGIRFQLEYNEVRPYTYAHSNPVQNYAHYSGELAHPYGANFKEGIVKLNYVRGRWLFDFHAVYAHQGISDYFNNRGENIFRSNSNNRQEYNNFTTQGMISILNYQSLKAAYLINPKWRLLFEVGLSNRNRTFENQDSQKNQMIHIGFKTALYNQYFDY